MFHFVFNTNCFANLNFNKLKFSICKNCMFAASFHFYNIASFYFFLNAFNNCSACSGNYYPDLTLPTLYLTPM